VTSGQISIGIGLIVALAVACQIAAARFRLPAIILLLPVGFVAGVITGDVNGAAIFGSAFSPLVSLAVAVILFDGGLDLQFAQLEGHSQRVVRRLLAWGIPITWAGATLFAIPILGLPSRSALMLGAILIVSGPTVVAPLLRLARPGPRLSGVLAWESTTIDPIGAVIGVVVFAALKAGVGLHLGLGLLHFASDVGLGLIGGAIGTAVVWFCLNRLGLKGVLATEAVLATVVGTAGVCNAVREDSGLIAAITMGVALANIGGTEAIEDRPFFQTVVQLTIGVLFISISAGITPGSLKDVLGPAALLAVCLIVVVRPVVAAVATARTSLRGAERAYVGFMDPRGIVAASTAATFGVQLVAAGLSGAEKLVPATFTVIVVTVTVYGLLAAPVARGLGLRQHRRPIADDVSTRPPPPAPGAWSTGAGPA
jgi:NhaP-type Na+/H+ or K+/H+ antiporter